MSRLASTALALASVGVITLAGYADPVMVAAAVGLVQVLVATAPAPLNAAREPIGSSPLLPVLAASIVATVLTVEPTLLSGAEGTSAEVIGASDTGMLSALLPAAAVGLFVALGVQMLRRDGRPDLVRSASYAVALACVAALASGWIGATQSLGDAEAVAVGAAGVAAGLGIWAVPMDRWLCLSLSTVGGAAAGAVVAATVESSMTVYFGVVVGAGAALFAVIGQVVGRAMMRGRHEVAARWGFPGALSVAFAAPVVYIGGQLITIPSL